MGLSIRHIAEHQYGLTIPSEYQQILDAHDCDVTQAAAFAIAIFRIQRQIFQDRYLRSGGDASDEFLRILSSIQRQYCSCELFYSANIGNNFLIVHTLGIVVGPRVSIGDNCTMYQGVTIGTKYDSSKEFPSIGNDVIIYAGAKILGPIRVADGAVIGANAVVIDDVPPRSVVAGLPARVIGKTQEGKYKLPIAQL